MESRRSFDKRLIKAISSRNVNQLVHLCRTHSNRKQIVEFKSKGYGLIHVAAMFGSVALLGHLLTLGVDVKTKTDKLYSAAKNTLLIACEYGNFEVVNYLLHHVSDGSFRNAIIYQRNNYKNALYYAAKVGNIDIVRLLIRVGHLNINKVFQNNKTILLTLIEEEDNKAVDILCQCKANVNLGRLEGRRQAIHIAAEKRDGGELLNLLLTCGASVNKPWGNQQPLFIAVKHGLVKNARVLLKAGANVHSKGSSAKMGFISCFCLAAIKCPQLMSDFLCHGANPNDVFDGNGDSVLTLVTENALRKEKSTEVYLQYVSDLLSHGADPNHVRNGEDSLLIKAIKKRCHRLAYVLLEANADVIYKNSDGLTAFDIFTDVCVEQLCAGYQTEAAEMYVLRSFFNSGIDMNQPIRCGLYPLTMVIWLQSYCMAKWMIANGAYVNVKDDPDNTFLDKLAGKNTIFLSDKHQNPQLARNKQNALYEKEQDSSSGELSVLTRIICHMSNMSEKMKGTFVHLLLNGGADPNPEKIGQDSPLIYAVKLNKPELVKTLLRFGSDVNHVGLDNSTALQICCSTHRDELILENLLKKKPLVNVTDKQGNTPLANILNLFITTWYFPLDVGHVIRRLLSAGAEASDMNLNKALMRSAKIGDFKTMECIIRYGADKHTVDNYGNTILHVCWCNSLIGALDFIKFYVRHGGELNIRNNKGDCPLNSLVSDISDTFVLLTGRTNEESVKEIGNRVANIVLYFLEHNACDIPDKDGNTLLHTAAKHGLYKTVILLMKRGWNAFDRDKDENTALHLTLKSPLSNVSLIVTELLKGGKSRFGQNKCGQSVLYLATLVNRKMSGDNVSVGIQPLVTGILLNHGEDPNQHSAEFIPLISAVNQRDMATAVLLLEAGANINSTDNNGKSILHTLFTKDVTSDAKEHRKRSKDYETDQEIFFTKMLLQKGICVNTRDNNGRTALFALIGKYQGKATPYFIEDFAEKLKNEKPLQLIIELIQYGADLNICCNSGETVLSIFCKNGANTEIGELLLQNGADPSLNSCVDFAKNNYQSHKWSEANRRWNSFMTLLLQKGANPNMSKGLKKS